MADSASRTLPASERKRKKARAEGQVARSRDAGHLLTLGAGGALLALATPWLVGGGRNLLAKALTFNADRLAQPGFFGQTLGDAALLWVGLLLVLGVVAVLLALAAATASGGWNFTWKAISPKFEKLNPITGFGQMFQMRRLGDLAKATFVAMIAAVVGGVWLWQHGTAFQQALGLSFTHGIAHSGGLLLEGFAWMLPVLVVAAVVDVPLQRFMLGSQLKMSHQEAKQEHKETEGSPEVKGRMRQRMREASRRRMMGKVPTADLVVMNPSHYAVALRYDESTMAAPVCVAKGTDLVALRIRDLAREHAVPVLEAPPLARALYAHTELDHPVPARLFTAVAQVLAHVWRLRAWMRGEGPAPGDLPDLDVPADLDPHDPAFAAASAGAA